MTATPDDALIEVADRMWDAVCSLDDVRGDTAASEWLTRESIPLMTTDAAAALPTATLIAEARRRRLAEEEVAC